MENALKSAQVILTSKGSNLNILWGNTEMTDDQKFENLKTLIENLPEIIPRGINNIKSINLQGINTKSIPIYRNVEIVEEIEKQSGLELEKWSKHQQTNKLLKEVQMKKQKLEKKPKKIGNSGKKRKLPKGGRKAKKAKIEE